MKPTLADRINTAIAANDKATGLIPMGKGPIASPIRTYLSPTDSYEDEIGPIDTLHGLTPGSIRAMWSVADQQQASVPVTNLTASGNTNSNALAAIQGGIPQNPIAPAGVWSVIPQMSSTIKATGGPVIITGSVSLDSSSANDTIFLAIYRDGNLIFNPEEHTLPTNLKAMKAMTVIDNPPIGNHVYAMYWKPGTGTLTAVSNYRNFIVLNLTPS